MYLDFYKLNEFPFSTTCEEKFFYESSIHSEALANMTYTVQQRKGMVLVTGEIGAGKTFLGNVLGARLGPGCLTIMLQAPPQSGKQLIRGVATQAGVNTTPSVDKLTLIEELHDYLTQLHRRGRLAALIVDECQDLSSSALEEIRLLWNWESQGQRLLQIVLIGQPNLRERLQQAKWEALRQRIVLSYHLGHLSAEDTGMYIDHRIKVASGDDSIVSFSPEAKEEINAATGGTPRVINILCDNALLVGYARGVHIIDRTIVTDVIRNMTCWDLRISDRPPKPPQANQIIASK